MADTFRATDLDIPLAADEIGGVKYLRVKMNYGDNNSATEVSSNNPLPVTSSSEGLKITTGDSAAIDAFGRLRVSNPAYVFDNQNQYGLSNTIFNTDTALSGSIVSTPNRASVYLNANTVSGSYAISQSKKYCRYQPGKSQLVLESFVFGESKANVRKRIGYFDIKNGVFLEQVDSDGVRIVKRSYVSGSAVDVAISQINWNIDPLDGNGPSGIILDFTKAQILIMDFEWLGVGRVRVGFVIDGLIYYAHEFYNANVISSVYMTTANLPVRAEIQNIGTALSASTLEIICSAVISEGGYDRLGFPFAIGNNATLQSVSTRRPILSIKPNLTFNNVENRMDYDITGIEIASSLYSSYYEVVYNGTLNSGNFVSVASGYSSMSYDTTSTTISGGIVVAAGYAIAGGPGANATGGIVQKLVKIPLALNIAGTDADILTIVVTCTDSGKTASVGSVVSWQEIR